MRADLADVRLADRVFAPHYAQAVDCRMVMDAPLRPMRAGVPVATLAAGDRFEALDLVGDDAWGIAPDRALVGYVERRALDGFQ